MQCEGIGVFSVPIWPVKNLIEKSFVHGWLGEVVQGLHPVALLAIARLFRQICCGCAVHTQCCSTGQLLGHSLHLGARHVLQCSICCSLSLFQRCAFLHVKMQKCSSRSHQLLIAIIKQGMQAQQRQAWAQQHWGLVLLPAEQKIVSQLEVVILSHTGGLNLPEHQECVLCLPEQPGSTTASGITQPRRQHSSTDDATATQLEAVAVKSEQYGEENEGKPRNWSGLKQSLFCPLS